MASRGILRARTLVRLASFALRPPCAPAPNQASLLDKINSVNRVKWGQFRTFSRAVETEGVESLDQETEIKAGWMLKALAAATFIYVGFNVYPLMGNSLVKHSVALLRTKDPLFRRSGASRLASIATDEERRLKIVDAGGVQALVNMLESASDDHTRKEAVKALVALAECDAAVEAVHKTGSQPSLDSLLTSSSDSEIQQSASLLLEKLQEWKTRSNQ